MRPRGRICLLIRPTAWTEIGIVLLEQSIRMMSVLFVVAPQCAQQWSMFCCAAQQLHQLASHHAGQRRRLPDGACWQRIKLLWAQQQ